MKLNNKGITLVEVIVTFALLMIILVGLFNIILDVKSDVSDRQMIKDFKDYDNLMITRIQGDFITKQVTGCSSISDNVLKCDYKDDSKEIAIVNGSNGYPVIKYNGVEYEVPNSDVLTFDIGNRVVYNNNLITIHFKYRFVNDEPSEGEEESFPYGFEIKHPILK